MGWTTNLNWLAGFLNHQQYDMFVTYLFDFILTEQIMTNLEVKDTDSKNIVS